MDWLDERTAFQSPQAHRAKPPVPASRGQRDVSESGIANAGGRRAGVAGTMGNPFRIPAAAADFYEAHGRPKCLWLRPLHAQAKQRLCAAELDAQQRAGLSQGDVAAKMEVSQQVVAAWERKAKALRTDTLVKLASILNVSADELLGIKPARQSGPTGRVRQVFDAVAALPRRQQQKIVDVVEAFVEKTGPAR